MNTPVLFLIFNRPDLSEKVFEKIREAKPRKLFVAADGPRKNFPEDVLKCKMTREIIKQVDWDCELKTLFRDENLTCQYAVSSAINWFFEFVEEGIILEDDTLPDHSFFVFCETILHRYRTVERVKHINGTNFLLGKKFAGNDSYYFSNYPHPWGWATWKRAWKDFDFNFTHYHESVLREKFLKITTRKPVVEYWINCINKVISKQTNSWAYMWFCSVWMNGGYAVTPSVNLVANIGFGEYATNTKYTITRIANMKRRKLNAIILPVEIKINSEADEYAMQIRMKEGQGNIFQRAKAKIKLIINSK